MESSESSKVMELERARALLAEQNAALELATVEAEIADVKANLAMESLRIGTAEFVNRFDFAPVGYGFQQAGPFGGMFSLSSSTDRVHGRDYPWLVSEADIRNSVGLARLVTKSHCPGVAIERNLKAHVIGKGGNYTAGVRKGAKVPDGLLEAIQDLVDEFVDENKILGEGEHEWYWRGVRDGETIVGLYPMPKGRHGIVDAREIEPLQVCTPGMAPLSDEEIVKRCGHDITCATNWEFGVHKADHDAQQIFGYAIEYDGDWDYLPARYVGHWKRNVDRNVCRGVTDFYQAWQWISEQSRLLGNTTAGAAERSAIAYIVQHIQGVTQAKVRSMRSDKADATYTYTGPSGATKQFHRENIPPGSKLDIPKGQEYVAIANGTDPSSAYISVLQAISRQVGIVWNMPEGMISGDDSGASVTASVVAGSRFDKFATMEQGAFGSFMLGILWKVIKFAYDRGRLERFGFSRDKDGSFYQLKKKIELIVKYPDVSNKHPIETEQLRQIRKQNGVLSVKTWTDEVGLDYETERKNMEEEQGGQGGGQPGMPGADGGMPPPDQGAGGPPGMPPGGPGGMPDQGGMPGMPPGGMPPMPPDQGGGGFGGPPPAPAPGPNPFQQATGYDPYIESPQPGEPVGGQTAYAQPSGGVTFRNAPGFGSQEQFARSLATVVESAVEKAVGKLAEELKSGGASESFFGHRGRPGAVGGSSPRAEPWQLTQAQYREQHPKVVAANKAIAEALENLSSVMRHSDNRGDWFSAGAKASAQLEKAKAEADAEHEQHVLSRLMKGQDVPPHVLADYPHANPKVVLSGGDALPDMLAKLGSLGVAEAHAPAGFNHTSPLVIDGDQYTGARCCVQGLDINIENRAGTQRSGVSDNGEPWCVTMRNDYGEIVAIDGQAAHDGRDFDPVDVFLGPCCDSELVFVVDQYRDDGAFDEHKCMVGWTNAADAARAYSSNYDDDRECGPITPMTMDEFKDWLRNPARLHSPASPNAHVVRDRVDDSPELSDDVLCLLDIADKFGLTDEEVDALSLLAEKKHVAEAHAPKGFNKTSPLVIDGKSYVGGQFIPGKSQADVDRESVAQGGKTLAKSGKDDSVVIGNVRYYPQYDRSDKSWEYVEQRRDHEPEVYLFPNKVGHVGSRKEAVDAVRSLAGDWYGASKSNLLSRREQATENRLAKRLAATGKTKIDSLLSGDFTKCDWFFKAWDFATGYGPQSPTWDLVRCKKAIVTKILDLAELNSWNWGYGVTPEVKKAPYVLYVDTPFGQVSFHQTYGEVQLEDREQHENRLAVLRKSLVGSKDKEKKLEQSYYARIHILERGVASPLRPKQVVIDKHDSDATAKQLENEWMAAVSEYNRLYREYQSAIQLPQRKYDGAWSGKRNTPEIVRQLFGAEEAPDDWRYYSEVVNDIRRTAHEAHAPAGFNHAAPLVIDGKSYVGGQFVPGKSQGEVDAAAKGGQTPAKPQHAANLPAFGQRLDAEQAKELAGQIRDGDASSKNGGRPSVRIETGPMVMSKIPTNFFDQFPGGDDGNRTNFIRSTTSPNRVGRYAAMSGDDLPPINIAISRSGMPVLSDGGHRLIAAIDRGDKWISALVPPELHEKLHGKSTPAVREWASKKFSNHEHAKAFVEWFGDSKVVDKNGEPLVVYHGTSADFDEFDTAGGNDLGSHFGSIRQSDDFNKTEGGRTIPVYLSIKNPLRLPDLERWNDESMLSNLKEHGIDVEIPKREYVSADMATNYMHNIKMKRKAIAAALDKAGYDGIVYSNAFEGGGENLKGDAADSYIVFSPRQIKSATGNRGTFDPASNKITESIADQYGLTASERLAFEHATSWMPYHGPRGGHGWQSMQTGRVLYQIERPGDSQHEGPSADEPSSEAILAQQAEQAERERAARLERESREREIARRGQAKQSAMSQREMELQSERQRPEQAKRAAIAERERAEREREEEKPKPVKPYPKGKVSPFTAEVIDDARHIPFVDDVQQIASDDYDGIEAAMTPAEKREMNESLDTKKQEYIDEQMDGYEPYVDRREVAKDAGYDDEDVSGWFESQIDSMADDLSQDVYDRLKEHITEWYQKTSRVGTEAIDNAQDYLQRKLGDDYPDELDDLIDRYRNEAESEIDDAISEAESEVEDDKRQEVEGEYDDDEAREEYLDQFYQDNDDRFAHQSDEMEWGYDSDGDHVLRFTTEDGIRYSILAQKVKPIELLKGSYDISFHDRTRGYGITGKAGAKTAMEVFRKVSAAVVSLVSKRNPTALTFTAAEPSRQRLYDKLVQHVAAASPDYAAVAAKKLGGVKGYLVCRREVLGKLRAQYESGNIASMLAAGGELQTLVEQSIGEIAMPKPTKEFSLSPDVELEEINVDPESLTEEDLLDTLAEIESMERDENNNQDHTE